MFNNLSDKLDKAFHVLKGHGKITEVNVAETLKEVRRALLDADVNFKIAKNFTTSVKGLPDFSLSYPSLRFDPCKYPPLETTTIFSLAILFSEKRLFKTFPIRISLPPSA